MKISLIIPVYNAEKTLPACLGSIKAQRYRDFEIIFSDDASTDASASVLDHFALSSEIPCKVLHATRNRGAAAARKRAMEVAEGTYLAFADADDLLTPEMLERAAASADTPQGPADIVGWDWSLGFSRNSRYMRQADFTTPEDAVRALTGGTMRWNLWLFLLRRSLLEDNGIGFVDGADMGEDMQLVIRAFLHARVTIQIHQALYRYNAVSSTSISRVFSPERRMQVEQNLSQLEGRLGEPLLTDLKLYLKRPLLISARRSDYKTWYQWFPEANGRAARRGREPFHTYLLQRMAAGQCWGGVRLYYFLVHKLIYGILYR